MNKHPLICLFLPVALHAAPDKPAIPGSITAGDSGIVAKIGDSDVRAEELKAVLSKLDAKDQAALARDPAVLNQTVRLLLVQRLMLREAQSKKWDEQPGIRALVERARESAIAESYLQSMSEPPADYPGESELAAAYEAARSSLTVPKQWKLAQIYLACPEGASKEEADKCQVKLDAVKKKLAEKGADFGAIAKQESDEKASAGQGGLIGWMTEAQIMPEIRTAATGLRSGEISPAVKMADGWHILKCLETREATVPSLEDVRPQLAERMRAERTKANSQAYVARLLQANPLVINELALSRMLENEKK